ncbi:MAG: hypothetical protein MZV49_00060 [Rhodopseudomonas palustris]|nr:hypothetical protein [Rhodopseudomonas palustris]
MPIRTEYDKPGDPPSRDCTMLWTVEDPFAEPRIHRAFPGRPRGPRGLPPGGRRRRPRPLDLPRRGQVDLHLPQAPLRLRHRGQDASTRSRRPSTGWPGPATPAGPRRSPGTPSSTPRPTTRPASQRLWFRLLAGRRRRARPEHERPLAVRATPTRPPT